MKLVDVYPIEKWMELENEINRRTGLDANVFDTDGIRISEVKNWANRLCPAIKATDKGQSFICAVAHMNVAILAKNSKAPVIEECDAGLLKMVIPIFVEEDFVGAVGACGYLLDDGEVDDFMINKTTEIPEDEIQRLADDIPAIETAKVEELADYIQAEIARIVSEYENSKG
jgi:ligand-binding sensor protein